MSFVGIEFVLSPARRRDGSGGVLQGKFTKKRVIVCLCDHCGVRTEKKYKRGNVLKYRNGLSFCGRECADRALAEEGVARKRMASTCADRYGVQNPAVLPEVRAKIEGTCTERYGSASYLGSDACREATKLYLSKRGVSSFMAIPEIASRVRASIRSKYGVDNPSQAVEVKQRKEQTSLSRYGVSFPAQRPEARERFSQTARTPEFQSKRHAALKRNGTFKRQSSRGEARTYEVLRAIFPRTERHVSVNGWDIDIYVPELQLYVNYNGVYWHGRDKSDQELLQSPTKQSKVILATKNRDRAREAWFASRGIRFLVVWEDEPDKLLAHINSLREESE